MIRKTLFKLEKVYSHFKLSMSTDVHNISNRGFSQEALNYEKTRPSYTNESLEHVLQLC